MILRVMARSGPDDGSSIARSDVYAIGNLHYEFLNGTRIDVVGR